MNSVVFQYVIIAALVLGACYSVFKIIKKNFSKTKADGCDKNCGCS